MSSSGGPKDTFFKNVVNPYINELKQHPQEMRLVDGVLVREDVKGPKVEGDMKARLEEVEHEVFRYQKMIERGVEINHKIINELIVEHKKETDKLWDNIFALSKTTSKLQGQIYDLQNQNCEYEARFKRISSAASFRFLETKSSFVDGEPQPWKFDDEESPSPPRDQA